MTNKKGINVKFFKEELKEVKQLMKTCSALDLHLRLRALASEAHHAHMVHMGIIKRIKD